MTDLKLDSFLTPLSERARSPLYSTFAISWIVSNWKIWLVVFLFDKKDRNNLDLITFLDKGNYFNWCNLFWIPLFFSFLYIVILPWIDYLTFWYSEFVKRTKIDKKMEVGRKHMVSGEKYWDLKLKHENLIDDFSTVEKDAENKSREIKNAEVYQKQLLIEQESDRKKIQALEKTTNGIRLYPNAQDFFKDYYWRVHYNEPNNSFLEPDLYQILNNQLRSKKASIALIAEILFFHYNHQSQDIGMTLRKANNKEGKDSIDIVFVSLHINTDDFLSGQLNGNIQVTFEKEKNSNIHP